MLTTADRRDLDTRWTAILATPTPTAKPATLLLKRRDLVRAGACAEWLWVFDTICAMRGTEKAPLVRLKSGRSVRRPSWLRIELTPLTQLWLARDGIGALLWLREKGLLPSANLSSANLYGANLYGANLSGADRWPTDHAIAGWELVNGVLRCAGGAA